MIRRQLLTRIPQWFGLGLLGLKAADTQETTARKPLKIMMKSAWGSDDPTRASFVFAHGLVLADAGHEVQIFLTGEATYLMRSNRFADLPGRLAAAERNAGEGRCEAHSGLCLRGLLPCPWGYGNRPEGLGSKVRQSRNFRIVGRVGRPHHHRIAPHRNRRNGETSPSH